MRVVQLLLREGSDLRIVIAIDHAHAGRIVDGEDQVRQAGALEREGNLRDHEAKDRGHQQPHADQRHAQAAARPARLAQIEEDDQARHGRAQEQRDSSRPGPMIIELPDRTFPALGRLEAEQWF